MIIKELAVRPIMVNCFISASEETKKEDRILETGR